MNMNKTMLIATICVAAMVTAGGAYMLINQPEAEADITIACGTKNCYEPFWIADHYGYFDDEGVKVKMLYVDGGGSATTAILAGRADVTLVGADPAVRFIDQTADGMIIGTIFVNKKAAAYDFAGLASYGIDLNNPAASLLNPDGTVRVHTGLDTTTGYFGGYRGYLLNAFEAGKLTEDQYNLLRSVKGAGDGGIVHVPFDSQVSSLLNGEIQMLCSGNTINIAKEKGGDKIQTFASPYSDPVGCCVLIASGEVIGEKREALTKAMKAFDRACGDIEDPARIDEMSRYCADFYNASGWTVDSQKSFFQSQYWNICMMKDVNDFINRKAVLLDKPGFDCAGRVDYSFLEEMYGTEPYTYDPATGTLI